MQCGNSGQLVIQILHASKMMTQLGNSTHHVTCSTPEATPCLRSAARDWGGGDVHGHRQGSLGSYSAVPPLSFRGLFIL